MEYATAANVTGPWTYRGTLLSQRPEEGILATGSSATVQVPGTDDRWIVYHRFRIPGGNGNHREVCLDRVEFGEDGVMEVVRPTLEGVLRPVVEDIDLCSLLKGCEPSSHKVGCSKGVINQYEALT